MTSAPALDRLLAFFDRRLTRQGWLARREMDRAFSSDPALGQQLIASVSATVAADEGGATALVSGVDELLDLGAPIPGSLSAGLDRLIALIDRPGAFGEGCTSARHSHRVCEHFLSGFFAAAPQSQRLAPAMLPNGRVYRVESQARFALSCWMLLVVIRGGRVSDRGVQRHLDSFAHLVAEWEGWSDFLIPDLAFSAIGALAVAPERWLPTLEALVRVASHHQLPDGTWPRADFFNALDGLSRVGLPQARSVLERALPSLLQRQREDGSFGTVAIDERALIALRILHRLR